MKKFNFLLALLFALCGGLTATAQSFMASDAPTNGSWAAKTYWYTIKNPTNKNSYWVAYGSGLDSSDNSLISGVTTLPTENTDYNLWCMVGNETDGYTFYNKGCGTGYVLNLPSGEGNHAVMTATSESPAASVFIRTSSTNAAGGECFKLSGTDNMYMNYFEGGNHLSYWNSASSIGDGGSNFTFAAGDDLTAAAVNATTLVNNGAGDEGYIFGKVITSENITALSTALSSYDANNATTSLSALQTAINGCGTATLPTEGNSAWVIMGNELHTTLYVYSKESMYWTPANTGGWLGSGSALDGPRYLFKITNVGDDLYTLYSGYYDKYVGSVPAANNTEFQLVEGADNAQKFAIENYNSTGYAAIYDKTMTTTNAWHMTNWNAVVRWNTPATASHFKLYTTLATEKKTEWDNALIAKAQAMQAVGADASYIGAAYYSDLTDVNSALSTFQSDNSIANYKTLETAIAAVTAETPTLPTAGHYYTISSVNSEGYKLAENYDAAGASSPMSLSYADATNKVPYLWQFEAVTDESSDVFSGAYYIKAANEAKYLGYATWGAAAAMATADETRTYSTTTVEARGKYHLSLTDGQGASTTAAHAVLLRANTPSAVADDGTVTWGDFCTACEGTSGNSSTTGGIISTYNNLASGISNQWRIQEVTSVPVSIGSTGYATLNLPFAVSLAYTDIKAYTIKENGESEVTLTEATLTNNILPANSPVILTATANTTPELTIVYDDATAALTTGLNGTLTPYAVGTTTSEESGTTVSEDVYILKATGNSESPVGFYKVNKVQTDDYAADLTIPANKAYLTDATGSGAAVKLFNFGGESTGIHGAAAANGAAAATYYDLQGRRVLFPAHGVFVKGNGQKVFIK